MPLVRAELVDGLLEEGIDARHPDVEPNHASGRAARGLAFLGLDPNVHRRQIADCRRLPWLRAAFDGHTDVARTFVEHQRHERALRPAHRVSTIRQISTLRSRSGIVSGSRERSSATGIPSSERSRQPGRTPEEAAPP